LIGFSEYSGNISPSESELIFAVWFQFLECLWEPGE
jgi:hypothetical protein